MAPTRAFTLIELLVVIAIIAILAGLLLPVGASVIERAKRASAKTAMTQIVAAVKLYQTDYGTYPVVPAAGATPADTTYPSSANTPHNSPLFEVLRALNSTDTTAGMSALNARRTVYFEYKDVKNTASPRDGFIPTPAGGGSTTVTGANGVALQPGDLIDPWGNMYYVRIDTGYSDKVVDPFLDKGDSDDSTNNVADNKLVHTAVIAWAIGQNSMQYDATNTAMTFDSSGNVATWR